MSESKTGKQPADQRAKEIEKSKQQRREEEEEKKHLDEELEEALEMTFPASDPIAVSRPDPPLKKKEEPAPGKTGRSKMSKISGS
jgi:hypothetical protein